MTEPWWRGAVIYQIYPRSFADSNADGIGDLPGILARLEHLKGGDASLDVDAIWLSPTFPSPQADYGYDVADYTGVDPIFGSLEDMDRLIEACHARGLRILLDLVACHTSEEHPWFAAARSSRSDPHRDWYIWADPAPGGGPPNNWTAVFGGSQWTLDEPSGQYYLHTFYPEQPQLNWRNRAVAEALHAAMRFWFERGVDGFRVDAIQVAAKDLQLRDNPPAGPRDPRFPVPSTDFGEQEHLWDVDRPEVHDVVRGLRRVADEYGAVLVGELYAPVERLASYLGSGDAAEFQLAFNFELLLSAWKTDAFRLIIERAEALLPAGSWPTWAVSNHDQSRHVTRWGRERARLAAFLLLTLRGTAFLYAGEEIGMRDAEVSGAPAHDRAGRDAQRTPMQWDPSPRGGFTHGEPWLALVDAPETNVQAQRDDPGSLLSLYRRLIAVRRSSPALAVGEQRSIFGLGDDVIANVRQTDGERVLVVMNTGDGPATVALDRWGSIADVLVTTDGAGRDGSVEMRAVRLAALEGVVLRPRG